LALGAWVTDVSFSCPGRNAAQLLSQYVPTYTYEFNDENAPLSFGLPPASFPLGSYHQWFGQNQAAIAP
jgi:para-nitrobenzyl esterase